MINNSNETINLIHEELLKIAKDFHRFCEDHNYKYYIIGGTFIGAIRHKGFIPWDDDMDIAMPREDYEKFLATYTSDKYDIITYRSGKEYKYYLPKLYNDKYIVKEKTGNITNLFIDIFPIDGMPNNKILRRIHILRILYRRMKLSFYYNDTIDMEKKRKTYEKILIKLAKSIPFKRLIDPIKEKDKIDKMLKANHMNDCEYSGTIMGAYRAREIVETKWFGKPTLYDFEDTKLYGPEYYDEYLTHMYGDYMALPSKDKQTIHCVELKSVYNE